MTPSKLEIVEAFRLEALSAPVDLASLAKKWGVVSIEQQPLESDAMLVRRRKGYSIILKQLNGVSGVARQNFSFAHELGHLLIQKYSVSQQFDDSTKHRLSRNRQDDEEQLCEQLAAEILMPRLAFEEDGWMEGWSINNLKALARKYGASIPATSRRMIDLMPETGVMASWKPPLKSAAERPKLLSSYCPSSRYQPRNSVPRLRSWLITRASRVRQVQTGFAPLVDRNSGLVTPKDVPAEAWAWGHGEFNKVMVWYYPDRELSSDQKSLSMGLTRKAV